MLPGEYYYTMRRHADELIQGLTPHGLKEKYYQTEEYIANDFRAPDGPPVVAALPFADMLADDELRALLDLRFGRAEDPEERCPICHKPPGQHTALCPGYMSQIWGVHNDILGALLGEMHGARQATRYQSRLQNRGRTHLSDGHFSGQDGKLYLVDVSVVWRGRMVDRYREKLRHAENPVNFIPFVVNARGEIYEESRIRIQAAAPELKDDVLARVVLIPLAKRTAMRARSVARATLEGVSELFPDRSCVEERTATAEPNPVADANPAAAQNSQMPPASQHEATPDPPASQSQQGQNSAQPTPEFGARPGAVDSQVLEGLTTRTDEASSTRTGAENANQNAIISVSDTPEQQEQAQEPRPAAPQAPANAPAAPANPPEAHADAPQARQDAPQARRNAERQPRAQAQDPPPNPFANMTDDQLRAQVFRPELIRRTGLFAEMRRRHILNLREWTDEQILHAYQWHDRPFGLDAERRGRGLPDPNIMNPNAHW